MDAKLDPDEASSAPGSQDEGFWDLPQVALTFLALDAVLDLREIARKARSGDGSNHLSAEEELCSMLDRLRRADVLVLPPQDVIEESVSLLEEVLRKHLAADHDNEWIALHVGCQDAANQFARTLGDAADDFERNREELERDGSTDPAVLTRIEGFRNTVPYLRLAVSLVHQAGEPAAA